MMASTLPSIQKRMPGPVEAGHTGEKQHFRKDRLEAKISWMKWPY
jgi:hypothetical protein